MSLFLMVPINENGIIIDQDISSIMIQAMAESPFDFDDVYIYSHGWSTDANWAMNNYNRFVTEISKLITGLAQAKPPPFKGSPPAPSTFGVGIHWPSEISEDESNWENFLQQLTFYTMDKRAGAVGEHGVYALLRLILQSRQPASQTALRINLIGHSFGTKVVVSALQEIASDMQKGVFPVRPDTVFNIVLLQGAFDNDQLDPGNCYDGVINLPHVKFLITRSALDIALNKWYPLAHKINIFGGDTNAQAMGAAGPSDAFVQAFGNKPVNLPVPLGFDYPAAAASAYFPLVIADLTPVHQAREDAGTCHNTFGGHHSDIYIHEVYSLITGFLFG